MKLADLKPYQNNAKIHTPEQIAQIENSIRQFGNNDPIAIDGDNVIIEGHGRYAALKNMGATEAPCIRLSHLTEQQKQAYILVHNKLTMSTGFDLEVLRLELDKITEIDMGEFDLELDPVPEEAKLTTFEKIQQNPMDSSLLTDFLVPPFSILDTRQGYWQDRKAWWREEGGLISEEGRGENLLFDQNMALSGNGTTQTSIFDPVLCEIMYKWFAPEGAKVFDPFAGGSVRGIVAACMGHEYTGIDLRQEQVDANREQAEESGIPDGSAVWHCDDSQNADRYIEDGTADMIMTCPPYADLEVYSDDPRDISNMEYEDFLRVYRNILTTAARKLKENRFAIVVISDVRDKKGFYRDLPGETKRIMNEAGLQTYNEMILVNAVGSGCLRARRAMTNKKVIRLHQNVLAFYKTRENVLCFLKGKPQNIFQ